MEAYFERKAYQAMLEWKRSYAPEYALFLKGGRRVGKTTLAEKLGREQYRSCILVRFDQTEDAVAQALRANGRIPFFYKKADSDTRKTVMEIDFLIRQGNKVCPVEVKSGDNKSLKSLERFKEAFGKKTGTSYVLHSGEIKREGDIVFLPYYMASQL